MATTIALQANSTTETSISITMRVSVTYAATYKIRYGIAGTGGDSLNEVYWSGSFFLGAGGSTSQPYKNFTGLMTGESYSIWCELWNADTNTYLNLRDETIQRTTGQSRPQDWQWSGQVQAGGQWYSAQVRAGAAVPCLKQSGGGYYAYYLGASEWNGFLNRINEFRAYCGLSGYGFSRAAAGYPMQASQANQARLAIDQCPYLDVSPPAALSAGQPIGATWLLRLTEALNSIYR